MCELQALLSSPVPPSKNPISPGLHSGSWGGQSREREANTQAIFLSRKYVPSACAALSSADKMAVSRTRQAGVNAMIRTAPNEHVAEEAIRSFHHNKVARVVVGDAHTKVEHMSLVCSNLKTMNQQIGKASGGKPHQVRIANAQIAGRGLSQKVQHGLLGIGQKAAATGSRQRTQLGNKGVQYLTVVMKNAYKNKLDLAIASQHWTKESTEVPGRELHCPLRGDGGCFITCDDLIGVTGLSVVLARLDASGELKRVLVDKTSIQVTHCYTVPCNAN